MKTRKAKSELADALERVVHWEVRIAPRKGTNVVAAPVPLGDLELLEELEDRMDVATARKALAEARKRGERPIAWETARRRLGL